MAGDCSRVLRDPLAAQPFRCGAAVNVDETHQPARRRVLGPARSRRSPVELAERAIRPAPISRPRNSTCIVLPQSNAADEWHKADMPGLESLADALRTLHAQLQANRRRVRTPRLKTTRAKARGRSWATRRHGAKRSSRSCGWLGLPQDSWVSPTCGARVKAPRKPSLRIWMVHRDARIRATPREHSP